MALSRIQDPKHDLILWADAICINQQDNREKGHQVKQMAQIYKNAEEVLIWLGPSNEEIEDLLEFATFIDEQALDISTPRRSGQWASHCHDLMRNHYKNAKTPQNIIALQQLLSRRWFQRIWVLQEVAMARSARILCGPSSCPARTFSLMPSFFEVLTTEHSQAVLDLMPRIRSNSWWASDRTLHNLLVKFQHSQATDPRDMIYALLSMSADARDPTRFYPSYEIGGDRVYVNTMCFLIFGRWHGPRFWQPPRIQFADLSLPLAGTIEKLFRDIIFEYCSPAIGTVNQVCDDFIQRITCIKLNEVQILHCLSTFLTIALTSMDLLSTWFIERRPKLLEAHFRDGRGELQHRTKDKPERIFTLIFEQQNVEEEYRKMEFPIFDRFENIENLSLPRDLDRHDRRDGFDNFKHFTDLEGPFNRTRPTENVRVMT
jgi:hypothetical protein